MGELGAVWWGLGWSDMPWSEVNTRDLGFVLFIALFFVGIGLACIRRGK